ncbi:MAG: AEC family transporter [Candidatus Altiarchaeota archaeon]
MFEVLSAIVSVFIVIGVGWLARHLRVVGAGDYGKFNSFIYYVTLPALMFISLVEAGSTSFADLPLILSNACAIIAMMALVVVASVLLRLPRKLASVLLITAFFGNVVYMGYPVVELALGREAVPVVVIVSTIYTIIIFSLGIAMLEYSSMRMKLSEILRRLLFNPLLISVLAGLGFLYLSLQLPVVLSTSLSLIGHVTAPLALLSLGIFMHGRNPLANIRLNLSVAALKMAVFPLLYIAFARLFGLRGLGFEVSLIEAAMPIAVTNFVLADQYKLDAELVSSAIVLTTLLSPIALLLFNAFN